MSQVKMADIEDVMFLNSLQMSTVLFVLKLNLTKYSFVGFKYQV